MNEAGVDRQRVGGGGFSGKKFGVVEVVFYRGF
jgi:hypothetical protein